MLFIKSKCSLIKIIKGSLMAQWLRRESQGHEITTRDLEVLNQNYQLPGHQSI